MWIAILELFRLFLFFFSFSVFVAPGSSVAICLFGTPVTIAYPFSVSSSDVASSVSGNLTWRDDGKQQHSNLARFSSVFPFFFLFFLPPRLATEAAVMLVTVSTRTGRCWWAHRHHPRRGEKKTGLLLGLVSLRLVAARKRDGVLL